MPLLKGKKAKTRKGISTNIKKEIEAGKDKKVAVAIALNLAKARKKRKKNKKKKMSVKKESYESLVNKYLHNYLIEGYEKDEKDKKDDCDCEDAEEDEENVSPQEVTNQINKINAEKRKPVDRNKITKALKAAKDAGMGLSSGSSTPV